MNQILRLIIFDLDGTLVNAFRAVSLSVNHALVSVGYPTISHVKIRKNVGWGENKLVSSFVAKRHVKKALRIYRKHHLKALDHGVKFLPGGRKLIKTLHKQGFLLAIASNRPTIYTERILRRLGVRDYFCSVLCADKADKPKPSGAMLRQISKELSVRRKRVIYVGDMALDVQAGRDAGVKTIAVTTGTSSFAELKKERPLGIIHHLRDLIPVLGLKKTG